MKRAVIAIVVGAATAFAVAGCADWTGGRGSRDNAGDVFTSSSPGGPFPPDGRRPPGFVWRLVGWQRWPR